MEYQHNRNHPLIPKKRGDPFCFSRITIAGVPK